MSCYMNQLTDLLSEIGIEMTDKNRKLLSKRVSAFTGFDEIYCPNIRKELNAILQDPERRQRLGQYLLTGK